MKMKDNRLQIQSPVFDIFRHEFDIWLTHMLRGMKLKSADKGTLTIKINVQTEDRYDLDADHAVTTPQAISYKFSINIPTKTNYDNSIPVAGTYLKELPGQECFTLEIIKKDEQIGFDDL